MLINQANHTRQETKSLCLWQMLPERQSSSPAGHQPGQHPDLCRYGVGEALFFANNLDQPA